MYTWIFYIQATQNMYLNNIQQCNIELEQYFVFQEVFSFLSSTNGFLVQPWPAFVFFPWLFTKIILMEQKILKGTLRADTREEMELLSSVNKTTEGQIFSIF